MEGEMDEQERYDDAVRRLSQYNYAVALDGQGYIVRHLTDPRDVSYIHNLDDLVDLADLMEWAAQRRNQPTRSSVD